MKLIGAFRSFLFLFKYILFYSSKIVPKRCRLLAKKFKRKKNCLKSCFSYGIRYYEKKKKLSWESFKELFKQEELFNYVESVKVNYCYVQPPVISCFSKRGVVLRNFKF